jgi:hypothetical protein
MISVSFGYAIDNLSKKLETMNAIFIADNQNAYAYNNAAINWIFTGG